MLIRISFVVSLVFIRVKVVDVFIKFVLIIIILFGFFIKFFFLSLFVFYYNFIFKRIV